MNSAAGNIQEIRQSGKIAKNTFLLWGRMLVLTLINLYSLRILIKSLGDDDYGLYNAVAGVVTIFTSFCTVLSISTQRFYSYESGCGNESRLNEIFSKSLNLNVLLALVIILLLETVGMWYVGSRMVIPAERMEAVRWVYQFAIFSLACMLLQIPFMAAVMAHEDMGIFTIISTAECLLKLGVIFLIGTGSIDRMVFYGGGMFATVLLTFLSYALVAGNRYCECHYSKQKDRTLYKELLLFSGWTFYGSVAGVALIQGNTLLLNRFFEPFINAAFAVAVNVHNAFVQLCNSVVLAMRPAMIRSYAAGDVNELDFLFSFCNKILFFIVTLIGIPLIVEMPSVINVWLQDTTPEKILFTRLMIVYVMVLAMQNPITILMQASGNIKQYHILADTLMLMSLPVSWFFLRLGLPAYFVLLSMISFCLLAHSTRLYCLKKNINSFVLRDYLLNFLIPFISFSIVSVICSYLVHTCIDGFVLRFLCVTAVTLTLLSLPIYFWGLTVREKNFTKTLITKTLKRRR